MHRLLIGPINGRAFWRTNGIRSSRGKTAKDRRGLIFGIVWEVSLQFSGYIGRPDGTGNGSANGSARLENGQVDGGCTSNLLMAGRCLHTELGRKSDHATTETEGDLGTDDLPSGAFFGPVVYHQANGYHVQART